MTPGFLVCRTWAGTSVPRKRKGRIGVSPTLRHPVRNLPCVVVSGAVHERTTVSCAIQPEYFWQVYEPCRYGILRYEILCSRSADRGQVQSSILGSSLCCFPKAPPATTRHNRRREARGVTASRPPKPRLAPRACEFAGEWPA